MSARENTTQALARFTVEGAVDAAARQAAVSVIVDSLAVIIAGGVEPGVKTLASTLPPATGAVPSFWSNHSYREEDAALLFGMASHVLDYDDVSMLAICHPTVPVLTALLCTKPWDALRGTELCDAVAIGTEVMIRIGEMIGFRHYELGFHSTATLGVFGATAAIARLKGLSVEQTTRAFAIASSLSSGLRINFGSMIKSLHVGIAAANALRATSWAAAGIEPAESDIFSEAGFLGAFSGGATKDASMLPRLGQPFVLVAPGFEQKRFPCCYMLHKMIAGSLSLARDHDLRLDDVLHAGVQMPIGGSRPLIHPRPTNGMEALFSGPYAVLAAIADRRIGFSSFTEQAVGRPEIRARLADVEVFERGDKPLPAGEVGAAPVTVTLTLKDGRVLTRTVTVSPGSAADPLTDQDLAEKWADCVRRAAPQISSQQAIGLLAGQRCLIENTPVETWLSAIRATLIAA